MSEATAETKTNPGAEPTPAPAAPAPEKPVTPAPQAKTETPTTGENTAAPVDEQKAEQARKGFAERLAKREAKKAEPAVKPTPEQERITALEAELKAEREKQQSAANQAADLDILSDPKKFREETISAAREQIKAEIRDAEAALAYRQAAETTTNHLLTRSHVRQDQALAERALAIVDERYDHIRKSDPALAARLAYDDVCREKGIANDWYGAAPGTLDATKGKSAGLVPTQSGGGKKIWEKGEAKALLDKLKPGSPEHKKAIAEIDDAYREGRVKR